MSIHFKLSRTFDGVRISRRVLFVYYPFVLVDSYSDSLGFIADYCASSGPRTAVIHDPAGPNKTMKIRYNKYIDCRVGSMGCNVDFTSQEMPGIIRFIVCISENIRDFFISTYKTQSL